MTPLLLWHKHQIVERYRVVENFIETHIVNILHNHYSVFAEAMFVYSYSVERLNNFIKTGNYTVKDGYYVKSDSNNQITDDVTETSYNVIFKHDGYIVMVNTNVNLGYNDKGLKSVQQLTKNACKMFEQWECDYEFN